MPHFTFEPKKELEYLSERMKKFVEEFPESFSVEFGKGFQPRIDILQDVDHVYVHIELPGVDKNDVSIKIRENVLTVSGSKHQSADESKTLLIAERAYGEFSRDIPLPEKVLRDDIRAQLADGVLQIALKKATPEAAKEFNIEIS